MECSYYACMPAITIREVPKETRDELAARAARGGRSLQEYLRQTLIDLARKPDRNAVLTRIRERKARTGSHISAERIIALRDADRT